MKKCLKNDIDELKNMCEALGIDIKSVLYPNNEIFENDKLILDNLSLFEQSENVKLKSDSIRIKYDNSIKEVTQKINKIKDLYDSVGEIVPDNFSSIKYPFTEDYKSSLDEEIKRIQLLYEARKDQTDKLIDKLYDLMDNLEIKPSDDIEKVISKKDKVFL